MDRKIKTEYLLHHFVSMIGGFLGGYAIFNFCDVFGNAQTANLIKLVLKLFDGDFTAVAFLAIGFVTYVAGNVVYTVMKKYCKFDLKAFSLILLSLAVVVIGFFPNDINGYLAVLPMLFVTPIQWNSYLKAGEYQSATIFSTNNLRVATVSLTSYIIDRNKSELARSRFYWATLLCYYLGVALACVSGILFSMSGIWFCFVPISASTITYLIYKKQLMPISKTR